MATNRRRISRAASVLLGMLLASSASGSVPGQISYQGVLLDDQGAPLNDHVDLVFTLFDAASAGTPLWTEPHDDVEVLDGIYDVLLGSQVPITPAVVSGGALFLEVQADGETLAPRQRLVAVPYALEADEAGTFGGFDAGFTAQMLEHFEMDGGDPPNFDPREGIADVDADGIANFVDADNDGDGIADVVELSNGTDINLVTPRINFFSPEPAEASVTTTVRVSGSGLEPGLMVQFGTETPIPSNLTATGFDVDVGPQPAGTVSVTVSYSSGEQDTDSFDFVENTPVISGLSPGFADPSATTLVTVTGSGFAPGLSVTFGSETPTPVNLTPTSFEVTVGPQPAGTANVVASYPSGNQDTAGFVFTPILDIRRVFVTNPTFGGNLGGLAGADSNCQTLAAAASLPGTYLAWLSDGVTDPASRFDQLGGPYVLVNDTAVAADWSDLTDGTLAHPIDRTELDFPTSGLVWSNVETDGTTVSANAQLAACDGWTSSEFPGAGVSARVGDLIQTDARWTDVFSGTSCGNPRRLYCFEQ